MAMRATQVAPAVLCFVPRIALGLPLNAAFRLGGGNRSASGDDVPPRALVPPMHYDVQLVLETEGTLHTLVSTLRTCCCSAAARAGLSQDLPRRPGQRPAPGAAGRTHWLRPLGARQQRRPSTRRPATPVIFRKLRSPSSPPQIRAAYPHRMWSRCIQRRRRCWMRRRTRVRRRPARRRSASTVTRAPMSSALGLFTVAGASPVRAACSSDAANCLNRRRLTSPARARPNGRCSRTGIGRRRPATALQLVRRRTAGRRWRAMLYRHRLAGAPSSAARCWQDWRRGDLRLRSPGSR
jgi:hypothetical protein